MFGIMDAFAGPKHFSNMKKINVHTFPVVLTLFLFSCAATNSHTSKSPDAYSPPSQELYDTIAAVDSILFGAFNDHNLQTLQIMFSQDLEFYHDLAGVTGYQQNIDAFKKTFEKSRRVRRELVKASLQVYPIKDYGAVETGIHRFYAREEGQQEQLASEAKFVQIWQKREGMWKVTRVISYGHIEH
jgi:hypothetical protein